jgi:Fe-S-cluster containining protein
MTRAARLLGVSLAALRRRIWWRREKGFLVVDAPKGGPCPFHDADKGCTVYAARPVQCRTWPFWPEVVRRRRSWERAATECEGMNQGPRHGVLEIEAELARSRRAGVPEGDPW